jgi:predicted methyltransferase
MRGDSLVDVILLCGMNAHQGFEGDDEQLRVVDADPRAGTGYVPESYVIEEARRAGFVLEAKSEINANPKDTRDHPFGVWTLPPTRRSAPAGQYDAIGESDRMTFRFRKPD